MSATEDVRAPFTPQQVELLTRFQTGGWWHPFTCGRRQQHRDNEGILIATIDGWICPVPDCDYTQDWAHWFMADTVFIETAERRHQDMFADVIDDDPDEDGDEDGRGSTTTQ